MFTFLLHYNVCRYAILWIFWRTFCIYYWPVLLLWQPIFPSGLIKYILSYLKSFHCSFPLHNVLLLAPLVLGEVEVPFDVQQHLPEEAQPLLLKLLALGEHLLHVLHVLRGAVVQLLQPLLVLLPGLVGTCVCGANVTCISVIPMWSNLLLAANMLKIITNMVIILQLTNTALTWWPRIHTGT